MDTGALINEKLNEYLVMLAPIQRAEEELALARRMLKARTEEEIHRIAPVLGVLADALHVSTLDMLLAQDRVAFVQQAMERSGLTVEEITHRVIGASSTAREDLKLLGLDESL
jgi:hypothetical protein